MGSGGRGGGLPRVSEAQVSRAEHLPAPARGSLRPEPDLLLPGRQQEQGEPAALGAPSGGPAPGGYLCRVDDRCRTPDRRRPPGIRQPTTPPARKGTGAGTGEGRGLTGWLGGGGTAAGLKAREVIGNGPGELRRGHIDLHLVHVAVAG